jgi:hypothetical protein
MDSRAVSPHPSLWLLVAGLVVVTGCGAPQTGSDDAAKQQWQSRLSPQEFDQLRNRLMTSQTDR